MSNPHQHPASEASDRGYGGGGRTARPLIALIPIGVALVIVLAMLVEGVHVLTMPTNTSAGEGRIAQTAVPASGAPGAAG